MAGKIFKKITENIRTSEIFPLMAHETADLVKTEQLVKCLPWVDKN